MKCWLPVLLLLLPLPVHAETPGKEGFAALRRCVMENDKDICHSALTPSSFGYFDRFASYGLMPCLPTDFSYESETTQQGRTTVKASMPAGGDRQYILRLVFAHTPQGPRLDVPATFARGLGKDWENTIQMGEQIYLLMKQNLGEKLNCDMLGGLIKPGGGRDQPQ